MKMIAHGVNVKTANIWTKEQLKWFLERHHGLDLYRELAPKIRKVDSIWWSYNPYASEIHCELVMVYAESEQELEEMLANLADDI